MQDQVNLSQPIAFWKSISAKIYASIATCLIALLVVAGIGVYQFKAIGKELANIAEVDAPLAAAMAELTIHQLEQAILFERAIRAGEVMATHPETIPEFDTSVARFNQYNEQVNVEVLDIIALLKSFDQERFSAKELSLFAEVIAELELIDQDHKVYSDHAIKTFQLVRAGDIDAVIKEAAKVTVEEEALDKRVEKLLLKVEAFTVLAAQKAEKHESAALDQMLIASLTAFIVSASLAWWIVSKLVLAPLNQVSHAVSRLVDGDYEIEIETARQDEIGRVSDGLRVFRDNERRAIVQREDGRKARLAAEEARKEMMAQLRREFSDVVNAAIRGQFNNRVPEEFSDEELNELADGINKLVATVDQGLNETTTVLDTFSKGDLSVRMSGHYEGSFLTLKENVNTAIELLGRIVGEIRQVSVEIASNGDSMLSGSSMLAERTENQAATIEQTSATMEEMAASIRSNSDGSEKVREQVSEASDQARSGGEVVESAVEAMKNIEAGSKRISDIVGVIDSIAFQTNLLALNAAVEAARAGDAGKGFAVVAAEVRSLAQRSSNSSEEIRGLIAESAEQVQKGVGLVSETGSAFVELVDLVEQVERVIGDIASATSEQATGAKEIAGAINHMDQITQENATLAHRGSGDAKDLAQGAQKLTELVAFFDDPKAGSAQSSTMRMAS
ncbi:MAG: methyl-accepting chemotaxis protein [Pseudomonadota bacterium]